MADIRRATADEAPSLAGTIARAFRGDPIHAWMFPGEGVEERFRRFVEVFDRLVAERGWLWITDAGAAVALWAPPGTEDEYAQIELAARPVMLELAGDGGARYDSFWAWADSHRPPEPHWYLDHIAVLPERQGEGLGVALVEHGLALAGADGVPAFLETARERTVGFYERRGFVVCDEGMTPGGGPRVWFLRRDP